jgi:hypothetical protein
MAGKLSFLVGLGVGYVLGARSGRERYEQIAAKAQEIWQDPRVQEKANQAQQLAKEKGGAAASAVAEKAVDAGSTVGARAKDAVQERISSHDSDSDANADSANAASTPSPAGGSRSSTGGAER